jgi:hypothetical protein
VVYVERGSVLLCNIDEFGRGKGGCHGCV